MKQRKSGITLVEMLVTLAILSVVAYGGFALLSSSNKQARIAELKSRTAEEQRIFSALATRISTSVAPALFDPRWVFQIGSGGNLEWLEFADSSIPPQWDYIGTNAIPYDSVPQLSFGSYPARGLTSHDLSFFKMNQSGQQLNADVEIILSSRCVPISGPTPHEYTSFDEIEGLKRPLIRNGELECCDLSVSTSSSSTGSCVGLDEEWPTVFHYSGEDQVSAYPSSSGRHVLPGIGFVMGFDENPASYFTLKTIYVHNKCVIRHGENGPNCLRTEIPFTEASSLSLPAQLDVEIVENSGPVNSDVGAGSFIRLGPRRIQQSN